MSSLKAPAARPRKIGAFVRLPEAKAKILQQAARAQRRTYTNYLVAVLDGHADDISVMRGGVRIFRP